MVFYRAFVERAQSLLFMVYVTVHFHIQFYCFLLGLAYVCLSYNVVQAIAYVRAEMTCALFY